eukprot:scaffold613_cov243-Pinguiococcus_pyrenoidosus.AAC.24
MQITIKVRKHHKAIECARQRCESAPSMRSAHEFGPLDPPLQTLTGRKVKDVKCALKAPQRAREERRDL